MQCMWCIQSRKYGAESPMPRQQCRSREWPCFTHHKFDVDRKYMYFITKKYNKMNKTRIRRTRIISTLTESRHIYTIYHIYISIHTPSPHTLTISQVKWTIFQVQLLHLPGLRFLVERLFLFRSCDHDAVRRSPLICSFVDEQKQKHTNNKNLHQKQKQNNNTKKATNKS